MKQTDVVKKKRKTDRNKPLVNMAPDEFRDAMDEVSAPLRAGMLKTARTKPMKVVFVCIFLVTETDRRLLSYAPEYGDHEGIRQEQELINEYIRTGSLQPGESLELVVLEVPLEHAVPAGD